MKNPIRWLREHARDARIAAKLRLSDLPPVTAFRRSLAQLASGRIAITEQELTAAVAQLDGVEAASVAAQDGVLRIDLEPSQGDALGLTVRPCAPRFAPRGPKELAFAIEPEAAAAHALAAAVVACIGELVARRLWSRLGLGSAEHAATAAVDRDGTILRVDLRTLPWARELFRRFGPLLDVADLAELTAGGGALTLRIRLQGLSR